MSESTPQYAGTEAAFVVLHPTVPGVFAHNEAVPRSFVDSSLAALVASAPATLDTLKELADALGADPNFATTVAESIGRERTDRIAMDDDLQLQITSFQDSSGLALADEILARETADTSISTAVGAESARAGAAETALGGRIDTAVSVSDQLRQDLTIQGSNTTSSLATKLDKAGGAISGALSVSGNMQVDSFLHFGPLWRVAGSADGKRLVFQHRATPESAYRDAIPFIR